MRYTKQELQAMWFHNQNAITWRFYEWLFNQQTLKNAWYNSPLRLTYLQAREADMKIKKWNTWMKVIYREERREQDEQGDEYPVPYKRTHTVFNIEQCEPSWSPTMRISAVKTWLESTPTV